MKPSAKAATSSVPEPDLGAALERVMELMAIPGTSGDEGRVVDYLVNALRRAGAPAEAIASDDVHTRSPLGGKVGNLIFTLPGTLRRPRRLLMAHMDTVPLCVGSKPKRSGEQVRSADPATGLGADDRAGCAVVLTAALEILRRKLPHPPVVFFWPVQEEVGLFGAHFARLGLLKKPKLAFNWDGGAADKLTVGATGAFRIGIEIEGLASHAGGAPEYGVSAIAIAGLAIAELQQDGWLGDVHRGKRQGTSNIGVIQGGAATNVVTDRVTLKAECRSHNRRFRREILTAIEQAFERAAGRVRNVSGVTGKVRMSSRLDYEAFRLADREPCVLAAEAAVGGVVGEPLRAITNGGLDANWLTARGIPTVTLGCGQRQVHTTSEQLDLPAFRQACRIALRLATATEG
ncbi:MAG TPA: M20/M25/M40 family metallo-hydrolase [Pirellulales bacterium]|jgi:tripeptide aminopeptidase|nr:M20/M25/M40 family metallo-hydrolase [Pirellulales bacterium]